MVAEISDAPAAASFEPTISDAERIQNAPGDWQTWYITTPGRERRVEAELSKVAEAYLPLRKSRDGYSPAFQHYIFSTACIADVFAVADSLHLGRPIRHAYHAPALRIELTNLAIVLEHDPRLAKATSMRIGVKVEVSRGPWRGIKGTVRTMPGENEHEPKMLIVPIGLGFVQIMQFSPDDLEVIE